MTTWLSGRCQEALLQCLRKLKQSSQLFRLTVKVTHLEPWPSPPQVGGSVPDLCRLEMIHLGYSSIVQMFLDTDYYLAPR